MQVACNSVPIFMTTISHLTNGSPLFAASNVVAASVRKPSWKATMQPFVDADPIGTVAGSMM